MAHIKPSTVSPTNLLTNKMTLPEFWILRRVSDGKFFSEPTGPHSEEWVDTPSKARTWVDYDRCVSAATVWKKIQGEQLEVRPFIPITSHQLDQLQIG